MTREELLKKYLEERNIPINSLEANSIVEGIEWADEHPKLYNDEKYHTVKVSCLDELNRKAKLYDEFIDKAIKWLQENTYKHIDDRRLSMLFSSQIEMIESFRKAMEE